MKNDLKIHILAKLNDIKLLVEDERPIAAFDDIEDLEGYIEDIKG
jgi:hypothetical protein